MNRTHSFTIHQSDTGDYKWQRQEINQAQFERFKAAAYELEREPKAMRLRVVTACDLHLSLLPTEDLV